MTRCGLALTAALLLAVTPAMGQTPPAADPQAAPEQPQADAQEPERADPDARVDPLQPDFALAALPTTLRLPRHKWAFRVTHRFNRPLGQGNFGDLLSDAFGFDSSANIGLELRFGLLRGTQVGVHRTADKTIQLFGQHSILNERDGALMGLDALVTFSGQDNMRDEYQGGFGLVTSKRLGRLVSLHAVPIVLTNANTAGTTDDTTLLLGLGGRVRVLSSVYLLGEITPRLVGFTGGVDQMSFAIEMRPGGHLFQINVSNGWGTTLGQLASGGIANDRWYLGFNISRKFF
jgi:Membrane bound beta barrel domain (DUF5777)